MWLIVLLAAAGAVAAAAVDVAGHPRHVRSANYAALPADQPDDKYDLIFSSALWRHGDRAAEHAVPGKGLDGSGTDQFTEDDWTFGGGGYGELSPGGMAMHFNLGRKIMERYFGMGLLNNTYLARQIYVRSTDYNRTLVSAYSNVAGMYAGSGVEGQNFPSDADAPGWPTGYIPIPVHTVDYGTDYVGHPDAACPRQDELYDLVKNSVEYQNYINDPQISQILKYLSDQTGSDVTIDNMYDLQDPLFCEDNHIDELSGIPNSNISDYYDWFYSGNVSDWANWIIDKDEDFTNGIANPGGVNGVDVSVEIPKIRAGDTLKMVASNVHGVLTCRDTPDADACRHFYKQLKYYAISAHDTTVAAFLTILGVKKYIIPDAYPSYSAAVFVEVYEDSTTKERFFKVIYHADKDSGFKPITGFVRGCEFNQDYCKIAVLDDLVAKYAPTTDMATLCNTPVNGDPALTTTPKPVTGSTSPTTPPSTPTTTTPPSTTTSGVATISLFSALSVMILSRLL